MGEQAGVGQQGSNGGPPATMLAASGEIRSRPHSRRAGPDGSECGTMDLTSPPLARFPTWLPIRLVATRFFVIGQVPISATVTGSLEANCTLECLGRRNEGLFTAFRATLVAEPGRSDKGCRGTVAPLRETLSFSRAQTSEGLRRLQAVDARREDRPARERDRRRKICGRQRGSDGNRPANGDACHFQRSLEASV